MDPEGAKRTSAGDPNAGQLKTVDEAETIAYEQSPGTSELTESQITESQNAGESDAEHGCGSTKGPPRSAKVLWLAAKEEVM